MTAVRVYNESPQDVSLWYVDYFELKASETLKAQRKLLPYLNYLVEFKLGSLAYNKLSNISFLKNKIFLTLTQGCF